jgi:hypothetical protein
VLMVTRLDRLARSTRDLLNTLAAITGRKAGFRSLGDAWADTTTARGRFLLTALGGLAEFERLVCPNHRERTDIISNVSWLKEIKKNLRVYYLLRWR